MTNPNQELPLPLSAFTDFKNLEELQTLIDFLPSGVTLFDADQRVVLCNQLFKSLLGFPEHLFEGGMPTLYDFAMLNALRGEYGEGDPAELAAKVCDRARGMQSHVFERTRPNGVTLEIRGEPLPSGGWVSIYTDITERKAVDASLHRINHLMSAALDFSPIYIWETNKDGYYTYLQGVERILGLSNEDLLDTQRCLGFVSDDMWHLMESHSTLENLVVESNSKLGAPLWLSTSARPVFDSQGVFVGYRGVDVDITEITLARKELENLAMHDVLTGLANRRKFQEQFMLEQQRQTRAGFPISLLLVDIDHFKLVNDNWGHLVGDACLKAVAATLTKSLRVIDTVARFGGEEFLILLSNTSATDALLVAEKVRAALEQAVIATGFAEQPSIKITGSVGVTTILPAEKIQLEVAIHRADKAVYEAKRTGRNRVCTG